MALGEMLNGIRAATRSDMEGRPCADPLEAIGGYELRLGSLVLDLEGEEKV